MELLEALNLIKPALSATDLVPILQHFCFKDKKVYAYNHQLAILSPISTDLNCALPGNTFLPVLNSLLNKDISVVQDDDVVTVKAGRSKSTFAALPTDDFIFDMPDYADDLSLELDEKFIEGLSKCLVSVGEDMNHPEHLGITFTNVKDSLVLYSTDNKTLSKFSTGRKLDLDNPLSAPKDFCEQLVAINNKLKLNTKLFFGTDYIVAEFGDSGMVLFSKVDKPANPNSFEDVLTRFDLSKESFSNIPTGFKEAIDRTLLVQKGTDFKQTSLTVKRRSLLIKAENGIGQVEETVSLSNVPDQIKDIVVNPALVSRVCKVCQTMSLQKNAIIFIGDDYTHVIATTNS